MTPEQKKALAELRQAAERLKRQCDDPVDARDVLGLLMELLALLADER